MIEDLPSAEDVASLRRITNNCGELVSDARNKPNLVEYGLALAGASLSVRRALEKLAAARDHEALRRYERLEKLLHNLIEEE